MNEEIEILYVDDEYFNLLVFEKMLEGMYKTHVASSGEEALKMLEENKAINVIISDIKMPNMNGFELLNKLKISHPNISRYLASGHLMDEKIEDAITSGLAKKFLTKPYSPADLKLLVS